jgi:hypothetical protein
MTREPNEPTGKTRLSKPELKEIIRRRAHELYEKRGGADGFELNDWLQAESEVMGSDVEKAA